MSANSRRTEARCFNGAAAKHQSSRNLHHNMWNDLKWQWGRAQKKCFDRDSCFQIRGKMAKCQQSGRKSLQTKIFFSIRTKGHSPTRTRGDFSERCYISQAWSGERRATPTPAPPPPSTSSTSSTPETEVLVCYCGCGVWLCGCSKQSCHVAFPFRSHLLGEGGGARSCVRRNAVTAWQPRFRQRDGGEKGRGGRIGCLEQVCNCVCGVFRALFSPLPLHTPYSSTPRPPRCSRVSWCIPFSCVLLQCLWLCERWKFNETNC